MQPPSTPPHPSRGLTGGRPATGQPDSAPDEWVDTWVCTPQPTTPDNLPPAPFTADSPVPAGGVSFADCTLRQTVRATIGGQRLRLCFSHRFGVDPLLLTGAGVAQPLGGQAGVSAIRPGTSRPVTFGGRPSVAVPPGGQVVSDPVDVAVAAGSNLAVTVYLAQGQPSRGVTSHPGSRTTSYLRAGNWVTARDLPRATAVDHWYFLSRLQVPAGAGVAVVVGDSLTDGRGSTTNRNNRWPDLLFDRLQSHPDTGGVAILNHGVGGSRLLDDGQGPGAVDRLIAQALARPALRWLVVCKGVNDLGTAAATGPAQQQVAADLVAAYEQIITASRTARVRVYGATLLPFGGHAGYDDPPGLREATRQQVNEWIRTSGRFDRVLDFDLAVRDPGRPRRLAAAVDEGDHLHLNPAGYQALAAAVPTHLFHP